jgi:UDP-N-acetylglucosamine 2-epimerase
MEPTDFLRLLVNAKCLIGNSSVGIRECAFLGVPVVNIGTRQNRRDRGHNTLDVGYSADEIQKAILHWLSSERPEPSNVYGGGNAGQTIAKLLAQVDLKYHKTISY